MSLSEVVYNAQHITRRVAKRNHETHACLDIRKLGKLYMAMQPYNRRDIETTFPSMSASYDASIVSTVQFSVRFLIKRTHLPCHCQSQPLNLRRIRALLLILSPRLFLCSAFYSYEGTERVRSWIVDFDVGLVDTPVRLQFPQYG